MMPVKAPRRMVDAKVESLFRLPTTDYGLSLY